MPVAAVAVDTAASADTAVWAGTAASEGTAASGADRSWIAPLSRVARARIRISLELIEPIEEPPIVALAATLKIGSPGNDVALGERGQRLAKVVLGTKRVDYRCKSRSAKVQPRQT